MSHVTAFSNLLSPERVRAYQDYDKNCATFDYSKKATTVIFPENEAEIKACLHYCHQQQLTFIVISTGLNWGYGSATPATDVDILFDLRYMNRIISVNHNEGYAILEPGVTQLQLLQYLQQHHPDLLLDITGGPLSVSMIANALERGHGLGLYGDHAQTIYNLHVLLANQQKVITGSARYLNADQINQLNGSSLGADYSSLFIQSNFGIVTQATVVLQKRPASIKGFFIPLTDAEPFSAMIAKIKQLKQQKIIQTTLAFSSAERILLAEFSQSEIRALTEAQLKTIYKERGIGRWNLFFSVQGDHAYTEAMQQYFMQQLTAIEPQTCCYDPADENLPAYIRQAFSLVLNKPDTDINWSEHLHYTNQPQTNTGNPANDGCGVVFMTCSMPFIYDSFITYEQVLQKYCDHKQFNWFLQAFQHSGMILNFYFRLCFDRDLHGQQIPSMVNNIQQDLIKQGFMIKRPSHLDFDCLSKLTIDRTLYQLLKTSFDPNNLMQHNHYSEKEDHSK